MSGVKWDGLLKKWTDLSHDDRLLCCKGLGLNWVNGSASKEATIEPIILMQNHRVGWLLECMVWACEWRVRSFAWRKKNLASAISGMRPIYSSWCISSSTDFWRFRIQLNLFKVWTLSLRTYAIGFLNRSSFRYPTIGMSRDRSMGSLGARTLGIDKPSVGSQTGNVET